MQSFKRSSAQFNKSKKSKRPKERFRGSARERGYDRDWEKLAAWYKKQVRGLCEECYRQGFVKVGDVVDHMEPVTENPSRRLDPSNLDCLCHSHHNGLKRKIEAFAKKSGQVKLLSQWMKFPETRPIHFQILNKSKSEIVGDGLAIIQRTSSDFSPADIGIVGATPKVITPTIEGVVIFQGAGVLSNVTNSTAALINIFDGEEEVYFLHDGQSLDARIEIFNGLTIKSDSPTNGKVSMTYVQSQNRYS